MLEGGGGFHLKYSLHIAETYSSTIVRSLPHALMSLKNSNRLLVLFLKNSSGGDNSWSRE